MNKRIFIALVIVFTGVSALLFNAFYKEAKNIAFAKLNDQQMIHAKQAAHGIKVFFGTWTGTLNSLSKMNEIIDTDADGKRYMKLFYEAHRDQIRSITRMNERGTIIHTVPYSRSEGRNISGQTHVQEILKEHKPVVSDVFKTVQGFYAVALHVPVFRGSVFKGTIAIVINFETIARRYLDIIKIGETGYAWVVSRDGTMLYSPVSGFIGKSVFENIKGFPSLVVMVNDMLNGHEGTATYTFDRIGDRNVWKSKKYAVYMPIHIENTFWSIVVASDEQDVLSDLISFRNKLTFVIGALFICGMLFSTLGAKAWFIVKEEKKRNQAEDELRQSQEKFFKAFHATPDAIVISRASDGLLLDVNDVFLRQTGYSREEVQARTTVELDLWADINDRERYVAAMKSEGHVREMEARFRTKTGKVLDGLVSGESIVLGAQPCLLTIIRDITQRKKTEVELEKHRLHLEELVNERTVEIEAKTHELEKSQNTLRLLLEDMKKAKKELETANERLKELDRLKSMFIASMSHELRTPLNSIIGFTGMTLQGLSGTLNDEQRDNLKRVYQAAKHLLALISDVIDISKIEAGRIDSFSEVVSLKEIVDEAIATVELKLNDKQLTLAVEASADVKLNTDRKRLLQCLINLLSNGVKYTEKGGITITAHERATDLEISVTDTGIGIAEKDMPKLFDAFERLDTHLRIKAGGTGLGLYLTKKLATDILRGSISVRSIEGQGSTFTLKVPRDLHQTIDSNK